jgi:hypothetical protein
MHKAKVRLEALGIRLMQPAEALAFAEEACRSAAAESDS